MRAMKSGTAHGGSWQTVRHQCSSVKNQHFVILFPPCPCNCSVTLFARCLFLTCFRAVWRDLTAMLLKLYLEGISAVIVPSRCNLAKKHQLITFPRRTQTFDRQLRRSESVMVKEHSCPSVGVRIVSSPLPSQAEHFGANYLEFHVIRYLLYNKNSPCRQPPSTLVTFPAGNTWFPISFLLLQVFTMFPVFFVFFFFV